MKLISSEPETVVLLKPPDGPVRAVIRTIKRNDGSATHLAEAEFTERYSTDRWLSVALQTRPTETSEPRSRFRLISGGKSSLA